MERMHGNYESGGSIFKDIARGLGEIARIGAAGAVGMVREIPKFFDEQDGILKIHSDRQINV